MANDGTASAAVLPTAPRTWGSRRLWTLTGLLLAGLWAAVALDLDPTELLPGDGGWKVAGEVLSHAVQPAWTYEDAEVSVEALPLPLKALQAAWVTVALAAAATSLALLLGLPLGLAASASFWNTGTCSSIPGLHRGLRGLCFTTARAVIALLRSVHELIWAVLLLAALGISQVSAVVAIAIPYCGTLAKVFSELLDEAPSDAADGLRALGATHWQRLCLGLLPASLPDLCAYAFYRFECALRSSAVLGFFGYPTLGFYIAASFENLYYGEVWTYLYTLLVLVVAADLWSGAVRRRLVEG